MKLKDQIRLLGATMRITRLIVVDDVPGQWWIKDPFDEAMHRYRDRKAATLPVQAGGSHLHFEIPHPGRTYFDEPWWWKYRDGLDCPYCVSVHVAFWLTAAETITASVGGPWRRIWVWATTALALAEVAGHLEARLSGDDDE